MATNLWRADQFPENGRHASHPFGVSGVSSLSSTGTRLPFTAPYLTSCQQVTRLCDLSVEGDSVTSVGWSERVSAEGWVLGPPLPPTPHGRAQMTKYGCLLSLVCSGVHTTLSSHTSAFFFF